MGVNPRGTGDRRDGYFSSRCRKSDQPPSRSEIAALDDPLVVVQASDRSSKNSVLRRYRLIGLERVVRTAPVPSSGAPSTVAARSQQKMDVIKQCPLNPEGNRTDAA